MSESEHSDNYYMSGSDEGDEGDFDCCESFIELLNEFDKIFEGMTRLEISQFIKENMEEERNNLFGEYEKIKDDLGDEQKKTVMEIFTKLGICHEYH